MGCATPDNEVSSASVRRIAVTRVLDALVRFDWDGEDLPYFDDMWFALRLGCVHNIFLRILRKFNGGLPRCPQLRYVSTSIGAVIPNLNSHVCTELIPAQSLLMPIKLFDFQNLSGFSLTLKHGFYENIDLFLEGKRSRPIHCSYTIMTQK